MFYRLLFLCCLLLSDRLSAQLSEKPQREFRGVWVASVTNIDYPKKPTANPEALKREWDSLLLQFRAMNLNALVVQIRPTADAFYKSDLVPWSKFLTGQQGKAPDGGFDPLAYMIQTAKANNMEFHAWLNPYRLSYNEDTTLTAPNHVLRTHPEWVLFYGTKYYVDPGIPEVWEHLAGVVEDIMRNYDVDAIHFDDYFYPYRVAGQEFPDSASFARYGMGYDSIDDWRRHNVDTLIHLLFKRIKAVNPKVDFGISPFGVWRNKHVDPEGSDTRAGQTNYDDLFADVRKWLREGWIDYVVPQDYFHIGFPIADYEKILRWWADNSYGKKLYIGMAVYRVGSDRAPEWSVPDHFSRQIQLNRSLPQVHGHVLYNARGLIRNPLGVVDTLKQNFFSAPALWPERQAPIAAGLKAPELKKPAQRAKGMLLRWRWADKKAPEGLAYYAIYRAPAGIAFNAQTPIYRILNPGEAPKNRFTDPGVKKRMGYQYRLTVLDQGYREIGK